MKHRPEVLIIGGGVIGVCAAYFLTEHGHEVTLLERKDICSGCSYGNAGLTEYSHAVPIAEPGVVSSVALAEECGQPLLHQAQIGHRSAPLAPTISRGLQ